MDDRGYLECKSCGATQGRLEHSHNMPVGQYKKLETDPNNFDLRCRVCHTALDYPDFEAIIKFKDFHDLMSYRFKMDIHAYNRWVSCLIAIGFSEYNYVE